MALFQKRPQVSNPVQYATVGLNKTLLFVGLGNPGAEYEGSRHNAGFMCLDDFAKRNSFDPWLAKKDLKCELTQATLGDTRVILCKPQTFMNLSGEAVQAVMHFYKLHNAQLVVVHDELDVNFGQIRMRAGGSPAGNNGVKSVSQHIGEDYGRLRIGIGPKTPEQMDTADFVLQDFSAAEQAKLPAMLREVGAILSEYAYGSSFTPETRSFL
ncbi:MAG TPA: aminoacyl-tRNA hydrolase [Candidatus Saccharimonadales bacterium]|nr:aminoacyl-tRNA hydrolase [Candidatus Saccharimonadales bacterium]